MYNRLILEQKIKTFLEEDCHYIDVSSKVIPENAVSSAKILAKSDGYVSGLQELSILYHILGIEMKSYKKDGEKVYEGEIIVELKGNTRSILLGERTGLNLLTHMSAITSTTKKYINMLIEVKSNVRIACTRKTLPGLRIFEKRAVELGGGDPHRFSLDDMVLLKDTHLKFYGGDVKKMLEIIKNKTSFTKKIEVEVEKLEDVARAAENGADIIMLDNMTPKLVEESIRTLSDQMRKRVIVEVSGGITRENIINYVKAGPDIISTSELTQFPSEKVDFSLEFD